MALEGHVHIQEFSVGLSLLLGALHALEPGHGKTALVSHLLTEKKSFSKPILLALSTAISHALSILCIALLAHGLLHFALHDDSNVSGIYKILHLGSGFLLVGLGVFLVTKNTSAAHAHSSSCGCRAHKHTSSKPRLKSWRTIALGFAVGLIPCPSALIALSSAITTGHWFSASLVVVTFSFGIFLSLLTVGLVLGLKGSDFLQKQSFFKRYPMAALQLQSGILILVGTWHFWLASVS